MRRSMEKQRYAVSAWILILILTALFLILTASPVYAEEDKTPPAGLVRMDGKVYYFLPDGTKKTGWKTIDGKRYYFLSDGAMKTGWKTIDGKRYYFLSDGTMKTGWKTIDGKRYYFGPDGVMNRGWLKFGSARYYLGTDGSMAVGLTEIDGKTWFFRSSGVMTTGWVTTASEKYYFTASGPALADGWWVNGGHYYRFDEKGRLMEDRTDAPSIASREGFYVSPLYAGDLNTREERIEAMIRRAYDYKDAGTSYRVCRSMAPGQSADCSGLVMQCLYAAGYDPEPATPWHHALPENEYDSRTFFYKVPMKHVPYSERKRGDLIFYNRPGTDTIIHIAIYLGNGKVIESWPPAVTDKYGITSWPHTSVYGVARPFE